MKILGYILGTLLVVALVLAVSYGGLYVAGFFRQTNMDINREITQHSQQYIETKRSLLLSLIADSEASTTTPEQRIAIVGRFCNEYSFVDFDVPTEIHQYAGRNC